MATRNGSGLLAALVLMPFPGAAMQVADLPDVPKATLGQSPPDGDDDEAGLFDDRRVRRKDDQAREFRFGGRLDLEADHLSRRGGDNHDRTRILSEVRMEFTYEPDEKLEAFVSVEIGKPFEREAGADWSSDERFELREAYLLFKDVVEDVGVRIGRQEFEDGREWLYDARLDALRVAYEKDGLRLEAAIGREGLAPVDLLNPRRDEKTDNFLLRAEYELGDDWNVAAYSLAQEDRTAADASPTFFGVQSEGTLFGRLDHWLELSVQRGRVGARKLRGDAIDAGLIYRFAGSLRPALVVGYARGSGGGDAAVDRRFRQTGFQDNEDRLTGLGNVAYYGELLAPSLSNLSILTFGAGLRPSKASSLDLVAHSYRQVARDEEAIRDSPFDFAPNGKSADVGAGIDLIGAFRLSRSSGLETKLGYFRPGEAFDGEITDAFYVNARFVHNF